VLGQQHPGDADGERCTQQAAEVLGILQAVEGEQKRRLLSIVEDLIEVDVGERLGFGEDTLVVAGRELIETVTVDRLDWDALTLALRPQRFEAVRARRDQDPPDAAASGA
jgi:hypothetical protein